MKTNVFVVEMYEGAIRDTKGYASSVEEVMVYIQPVGEENALALGKALVEIGDDEIIYVHPADGSIMDETDADAIIGENTDDCVWKITTYIPLTVPVKREG